MLRIIRKIIIINIIIRVVLKFWWNFSSRTALFFINRWPTSGTVNCSFNGYQFRLYNSCDDGLVNYFFYNLPYHEKPDLDLFIELSKKANIIIDIGANTGVFSILGKKANPNATIFSIEPYRTNAERLKKNVDLNQINNVHIHQIAIGEYDGYINLSIPKNNSITDVSSINADFSKKIYPDIEWKEDNVLLMTLDSFVRKENIYPNLIKCDVETLEMAVFKGADNVLTNHKPTILFECFLDNERTIFFNNILKRYNYYVYIVLEQGIVHTQEGFIPSPHGLNYLISPIKPEKTFISFTDIEMLINKILIT